MPAVEYVLRDLNEAHEAGWPGTWESRWDDRDALFEVIDGQPTRLIDVDGGEPEDNSFRRDWGWVPGELQKAYELGLAHGRAE